MNKKIVVALTLTLLLAALAPAQDRSRLQPNMLNGLRFGLYMAENNLFEARLILRLKDEIGLGAEQEQKIENLMLAYEESAIRRGSDIKVLELKFASLLKPNRVDRREMEKLARQVGNMRTDLQVGHLNYLLDVRDVLTAEQIQRLEKLKEKFRPAMRPGRMGGKGGPGMTPPPAGDLDEPQPEPDDPNA